MIINYSNFMIMQQQSFGSLFGDWQKHPRYQDVKSELKSLWDHQIRTIAMKIDETLSDTRKRLKTFFDDDDPNPMWEKLDLNIDANTTSSVGEVKLNNVPSRFIALFQDESRDIKPNWDKLQVFLKKHVPPSNIGQESSLQLEFSAALPTIPWAHTKNTFKTVTAFNSRSKSQKKKQKLSHDDEHDDVSRFLLDENKTTPVKTDSS